MTLKEKFEEILIAFWTSEWEIWTNEWESECEQVADEFAIGFADWLDDIRIDRKIVYDTSSIKELLEIYKKEKGL